MNSLIIGLGSIGKRHVQVLQLLGQSVQAVSSQSSDGVQVHSSIEEAFQQSSFDYVVVSNPTDKHLSALASLSKQNFSGTVLVEKPLCSTFQSLPGYPFRAVFMAYNLRFHPIIQKLKEELKGQKIMMASINTGQYLPDWREGDHLRCYSSHQNQGGGVLRDLSHELDYASWLFGKPKALCARGGRYSNLTVDSDEAFSIILESEQCKLLTIQINYYNRKPKREIIVNTQSHTYQADLVSGTLYCDNVLEDFNVDRNETYRLQHEAIINHDEIHLCSLLEGEDVMRLIAAVEESNQNQKWVNL